MTSDDLHKNLGNPKGFLVLHCTDKNMARKYYDNQFHHLPIEEYSKCSITMSTSQWIPNPGVPLHGRRTHTNTPLQGSSQIASMAKTLCTKIFAP